MATTRQAIKHGYRSGLEERVSKELEEAGVKYEYETQKIKYRVEEDRTYTPDFILPNGIIVETKGIFDNEDRRKHLAVREQHPELDIRLVFSNARAKLYKGSKTTYAMWCEKNNFLYSHRVIPPDWLEEKGKAVKTKRIKLKVGS